MPEDEGTILVVRHFNLMRGTLRVQAEEERLIRPLAAMLDGLGIAAGGNKPAFELSIREGVPDAPPPAETVVYEGPANEEGECVLAESRGRLRLVFPGHVSLVISADGRSGEVVAAPGHTNRIAMTAGILAIQAAIDATGQFMLHAAGLSLPSRRELVLISAQSGTGKTTTSLALAERGFGLCSDDAMVVDAGQAAASAWGLPRDLKVHRKTAEMMPWVQAFLSDRWNREGEQAVSRARLAESIRIEDAAPLPVAALFVLKRGGGRDCDIVRMSRTDALVAVAADNVRVGRTGLLPVHSRQFKSLAELVSHVPAFRLSAGSDLGRLGPAVMAAIDSLARGT